MTKSLKNDMGGERFESNTGQHTLIHNPAVCEVLAECPESSVQDVDAAALNEIFRPALSFMCAVDFGDLHGQNVGSLEFYIERWI